MRASCCEVKCKDSEYENILKIGQIGAKIKRKNQFTAKGGRFGSIGNYSGSFIFDFASSLTHYSVSTYFTPFERVKSVTLI